MGLDLHPARKTDDGWDYGTNWPWPQWSYGGFAEFRERLAAAEGFVLDDMKGFGGDRDWGDVTTSLAPLLNHSDCDGEMTAAECAATWPRLAEIVKSWPADGDFIVQYDISNGRELVRAMQVCAAEGLTLLFR